jgi:hypothetical protein
MEDLPLEELNHTLGLVHNCSSIDIMFDNDRSVNINIKGIVSSDFDGLF